MSNKMRAKVVKSKEGLSITKSTQQIYTDDISDQYGDEIIPPPYNLKELKKMAEYSSILSQCIDAYKTNIVGFGFGLEYSFDFNAEETLESLKTKGKEQWTELEEFIDYIHYDESAKTILGHMLVDREKTGNGFIEVIRDMSGMPAGIEYMDTEFMRVTKKGKPVDVESKILKKGEFQTVNRRRAFRRYLQIINNKKIYFKEYGDARKMNKNTGEFSDNVANEDLATEVIHFKLGSGAYGVPRWIGHLINMMGARKAEELNYMYFLNGRHVPAAILVENGMLSADTIDNLEEYLSDVQGTENAHKFLIIEVESAQGDDVVAENAPPVKVEIKSMADMMQQDALFLEYDATHRSKLRSSFRLPPLYTGEADEYNKATADTARKITEEQVFQPERETIVDKLNRIFLPDLDLNLVRLKLKGPDFRDPIEIARALYPIIAAKAVSANDLRDLVGQILGKRLEEWPEEIYNRPYVKEIAESDPFQLAKSINYPGKQSELVMILKDLRDEMNRRAA